MKTSEQYIAEAISRWGKRWSYSNLVYQGSSALVEIICHDHGIFLQEANSHLKGVVGCKDCSGVLKTTEKFLDEAKPYLTNLDTSRVEYVNANTKVALGCPSHGTHFSQFPGALLSGKVGCPSCASEHRIAKAQGQFISKAKEQFSDRWDYSEVEYSNSKTPVTIRCVEHGKFSQLTSDHLRGIIGCRECRSREAQDLRHQKFKSKLKDGAWDYSETLYTSSHVPVSIRCPEHGVFEQLPFDHLRGCIGCGPCNRKTSHGENSLAQFIESVIPVERNRRDLIPGSTQEVDIYVPSRNIAIEFNGLYYHSEVFRNQNYHYDKYLSLKEAGIHLIQVWEDDWKYRSSIVQRHLLHALGLSEDLRVAARKTTIRSITSEEARNFLLDNHIQGYVRSTEHHGIFEGSELVGVGSFLKNKGSYNLTRYATSKHVVGGHSKLVKDFERTHEFKSLVTFADLTFGDGDLYIKTGWAYDKLLRPDYSYLRSGRRQHKFNYRVQRFREDPNLIFEEGKTERQLAEINNLKRIYDAGKLRFVREGNNA